MVHAELKKAGKVKMILESPNEEKEEYVLNIKRDHYDIKKVKYLWQISKVIW